MNRVAYIQANEDDYPYSPSGAAAARGFAYLGYEVRFFRSTELATLVLTPATVVVGGVGIVRTALEQVGVQPPQHVTLPAVLRPYLGRDCWLSTVGEVREAKKFPVFVKPYDESKVFGGQIVVNESELDQLLVPRTGFPALGEDFPLLAQEPVTFNSEWRAFVKRGVVLGINHYAGDPLIFPAAGVILLAIGSYQGAPAGYSADFGVTNDGRTLLVEVNDGYSIGQGGLAANLYAELLKARWEEMTDT